MKPLHFLTVSLLLSAAAYADDLLLLKNGCQISGRILAPTTATSPEIRIATQDGITFTISRDEVEAVSRSGVAASEYEEKLEGTPDTAEGHLAMAQWCLENGAVTRQKTHLKRVLELEPENETAHKKLGHVRSADGKWRSRDERLEDEGVVRDGGRLISTQEKEIRDAQKLVMTEIADYVKKIAIWQKNLGNPKKHEEAVAGLNSLISDRAVPGLKKAYDAEKRESAKKLFINALSRIGNSEATGALLIIAVEDPSEDIRLTCVDYLRAKKSRSITDYLVARLSPKTSTNPQINYAAVALGEMGDRTAVPALIDALTTVHKFRVTIGSGGQTSATFGTGGNSGGGGFSFGGGTKELLKRMQNAEVLKALEKLTGVNFLYDRAAWINWLQNHQMN